MQYSYLDFLSYFGIGSAHPGGYSLTKNILQRLPILQESSILDAGCGTGRTSVYIAKTYKCKVTALDNNPIMVSKAKSRVMRERAAVSVVQGTVEALPFDPKTFDIVLSESVVVFTNSIRSIEEIQRILRNRGYFVCIEMTVERPLLPEERIEIQDLYGPIELLTEQQWEHYFRLAGFSNIEIFERRTVAQALQEKKQESKEVFEYDLSPNINPHLYSIWIQHEKLLFKYQHILGHRAFICKKEKKST